MNDLLKEAIADAKAVRQTALANAKLALEEAFTPRIQSMLAAKLSEEMEDEMTEEDRTALLAAWEKGISQRIILRALRAEGYRTSNESIANHKSGNCKCQKS
jgi:tRNA A37 N6-isopentenylltransferase MiaA